MQSASAESVMYIKARCNDCEPPVLVVDLWGIRIGEEREEGEEEEEEEEEEEKGANGVLLGGMKSKKDKGRWDGRQ